MRRRWPLGLAALIGFLLVGSMVAAVVKGARVKGSVPGKAAILGLAATEAGFVIGTADGVLTSSDGTTWTALEDFDGESLVAAAGDGVVVLSGGRLYRSADLENFTESVPDLDGITALSSGPDGTVYGARAGELLSFPAAGAPAPVAFDGGPAEILALAVGQGFPPEEVLAGNLSSGLWHSEDGGSTWSRILETPIRAAMFDHARPGRRVIGTAGGVLWSTATRPWQFTDLRVPVEALAQTADGYFAMTAERLLFESSDGVQWEVRSPQGG